MPEKKRKELSEDALHLLEAFSWPGNVRQLQSVIEDAATRPADGIVRERDLCQSLPELAKLTKSKTNDPSFGRYGSNLILTERRRFERALIQADNDREEAAKILGVSRATFFRRAKDLGLVKERRIKEKVSLVNSN
jgi:transcriptional regulator of acetoin/glycerol metabolism